jgi:hypothetical protein
MSVNTIIRVFNGLNNSIDKNINPQQLAKSHASPIAFQIKEFFCNHNPFGRNYVSGGQRALSITRESSREQEMVRMALKILANFEQSNTETTTYTASRKQTILYQNYNEGCLISIEYNKLVMYSKSPRLLRSVADFSTGTKTILTKAIDEHQLLEYMGNILLSADDKIYILKQLGKLSRKQMRMVLGRLNPELLGKLLDEVEELKTKSGSNTKERLDNNEYPYEILSNQIQLAHLKYQNKLHNPKYLSPILHLEYLLSVDDKEFTQEKEGLKELIKAQSIKDRILQKCADTIKNSDDSTINRLVAIIVFLSDGHNKETCISLISLKLDSRNLLYMLEALQQEEKISLLQEIISKLTKEQLANILLYSGLFLTKLIIDYRFITTDPAKQNVETMKDLDSILNTMVRNVLYILLKRSPYNQIEYILSCIPTSSLCDTYWQDKSSFKESFKSARKYTVFVNTVYGLDGLYEKLTLNEKQLIGKADTIEKLYLVVFNSDTILAKILEGITPETKTEFYSLAIEILIKYQQTHIKHIIEKILGLDANGFDTYIGTQLDKVETLLADLQKIPKAAVKQNKTYKILIVLNAYRLWHPYSNKNILKDLDNILTKFQSTIRRIIGDERIVRHILEGISPVTNTYTLANELSEPTPDNIIHPPLSFTDLNIINDYKQS